MMYSLLICTVLYILIALVLTGIENYSSFENVNDPLAFVFAERAPWIETIVSISAVIATTSVILVFQLGQPRIWMSMSRDGLLPKIFSRIHPKYKTPSFATIVTGVLVAVPALVLESGLVVDLTSIGTLFAFALVSAGVLVLPRIVKQPGRFSLPYINGQVIIPVIVAVFIYFFRSRLIDAFNNIGHEGYQEILFIVFVFVASILAIVSIIKKSSFIPMMGVLFCLYLMVEIPADSWLVFFGWMIFGLLIYFLYGFSNSRLRKNSTPAD
jgi:amino acid transporter